MSGPVGVGVIGAGRISGQYLDNLTSFPDLEVRVIADLFQDKAAEQAKAYGVAEWGPPERAFTHPDVDIIVNLTIPVAHAEVSLAAMRAGKHVWSEKPFALDRESGRELLETAKATGRRIGGAPDTFLGAGLQTARRIIDRGDIGQPLTGLTLFEVPGVEGGAATSVLSWDSPHRRVGHVEIVGTEGTLTIPDPNHFDGDLRIRPKSDSEPTVVPATGPVAGRGLGTLDIARSVRAGVPHRASGELAYHVLDTMAAITESIERGEPVAVESRAPKAEPAPEDYDPYARSL